MALKRAYLVVGFGRIHWVKTIDTGFDLTNHGALAKAELDILEHINTDYSDDVSLYVYLASVEPGPWIITGVDTEGLDLRAGGRIVRLSFETPIHDAYSAQTTLEKLARTARNELF